MDTDYFQHPRRFPKNAPGPFYTTGSLARETDAPHTAFVWCGDCLQCEAPELEAPELLAPLRDGNTDTYFVRQPATPDEITKACRALQVCCVLALRYGGRDHAVIRQLGNDPEYCDYIIDNDGQLVMAVHQSSSLHPFVQRLVDKCWAGRLREARKHDKKWWQFWR